MRVLILFLLLSSCSFSQNTGLYGRKSVVEFQALGSVPLLANWLDFRDFYRVDGDNLRTGRNFLDYGVRFGVMHGFTNQFGLGVEFCIERQGMASPDFATIQYESNGIFITDYVNVEHEFLRLNTISIMPKLEFSSRENLLPIGLSHQLGFGYARTTVDERDYIFNADLPAGSVPTTNLEESLINYNIRYTGYIVMYQANMRTPITERLMINYGLRYTANFVRQPLTEITDIGEFAMLSQIRSKRNLSFIQLNLGMSLAF